MRTANYEQAVRIVRYVFTQFERQIEESSEVVVTSPFLTTDKLGHVSLLWGKGLSRHFHAQIDIDFTVGSPVSMKVYWETTTLNPTLAPRYAQQCSAVANLAKKIAETFREIELVKK